MAFNLFGKRNEEKEQERRIKYAESKPIREKRRMFARGIEKRGSGFLKAVALQRRRSLIYARDVRRPLIGSSYKKSGGGRGRPKGSYDPRYAQYGGVYGFRKILSAKLREQRMQTLRNMAINPQQQAVLQQIEARRNQEAMAPENQTIPDTRGGFNLKTLHQEIEDATNLVA